MNSQRIFIRFILLLLLPILACNLSQAATPVTPLTPAPLLTQPAVTPPTPPVTLAAIITTSATPPTTPPIEPSPPITVPTITYIDVSYEDRTSPTNLLASYFNAINRQEYERAYTYLGEAPTLPFDQFAQNYSTTATIIPLVIPPTRLDGAAGSVYTQIPTFLLITHHDGRITAEQGCTVGRFIIQQPGGEPAENWHIYDWDMAPAPALQADLAGLAQQCPLDDAAPDGPVFDVATHPADLLASLFDAVNRQDYARAFAYWNNPTVGPLEQFAQGYADTAQVIPAVIPFIRIGAAAGNQYAEIPTFLLATHQDGTLHPFLGCYIAHRAVGGVDDPALWPDWEIVDATIQPAAGPLVVVDTLSWACPSGAANP